MIATVILVSVTIVVAVAVSYWMGGIAGLYTRFEKIECTSYYASLVTIEGKVDSDGINLDQYDLEADNGSYYKITIHVKNSGSADANIQYVILNGKPTSDYDSSWSICIGWKVGDNKKNLDEMSMSVPVGQSGTIYMWFSSTGTLESGTTLNLQLHSAAGKDYPVMLSLP